MVVLNNIVCLTGPSPTVVYEKTSILDWLRNGLDWKCGAWLLCSIGGGLSGKRNRSHDFGGLVLWISLSGRWCCYCFCSQALWGSRACYYFLLVWGLGVWMLPQLAGCSEGRSVLPRTFGEERLVGGHHCRCFFMFWKVGPQPSSLYAA